MAASKNRRHYLERGVIQSSGRNRGVFRIEAEPLGALALDDELPVDPPAWPDASGSLVSFAAAAAAATLAILRPFLSSVRTI